MQVKTLTALKSIENAIKDAKMTKSKKKSKTWKKFDFEMETKINNIFQHVSRSFLWIQKWFLQSSDVKCIRFVSVAFRGEDVFWRRDYFGPWTWPN